MTYFYVKESGTTDIKKKADTFLCISKEQMDRLCHYPWSSLFHSGSLMLQQLLHEKACVPHT